MRARRLLPASPSSLLDRQDRAITSARPRSVSRHVGRPRRRNHDGRATRTGGLVKADRLGGGLRRHPSEGAVGRLDQRDPSRRVVNARLRQGPGDDHTRSVPTGTAIVLLGDQTPVPAENRVRRDDACHLTQDPPAECLAAHRESPTLAVGQTKRSRTKMLPEDAILLPEIVDTIFLVASHPASQGQYEEMQSVGHGRRLHGSDTAVTHVVSGIHSPRPFSRTIRGPDFTHLWKSHSPWLNDFIHGGFGQLSSNNNLKTGAPHYPASWFWAAMIIATQSMLISSILFWTHMGRTDRAAAVLHGMESEPWGSLEIMHNGQGVRIMPG